jgi:hypothetical protein
VADSPAWQPVRRDAWRLEVRGVSILLQESEDTEWLVTCEAVGMRESVIVDPDLPSAQSHALRLVRAGLLVVAAEVTKVLEVSGG